MNRAVRVAWPALSMAAAAAALLAAILPTTGAGGLDLARAVVRLVLDLAAALVLGVLGTVLILLPADDPRRGRLLDAAAAAAGVWTVATAAGLVLLFAEDGPSASSPAFGPGLVAFALDLEVGRIRLVGAVLAAVLTAVLVAARSRRALVATALLAVLALVPLARQAGSSAVSIPAALGAFSSALVVQVAESTWIGVLSVAVLLPRARDADEPAVARARTVVAVASFAVVLVARGLGPVPTGWGGVVAVQDLLLLAAGLLVLLVRSRTRPGRAPGLPSAFARVELLLLGAATGLGAFVGAVPAVVPAPAERTTPAELLTGAQLPPPLGPAALLTAWQPDPLWLALAVLLALALPAVLRRVPAHADPRPLARTASWLAGLALLVWLTCGGPARYAPVLLEIHVLRSAALALVVPLLLAGGAPGALLRSAFPRTAPPALRSPALAAVAVVAPVVALWLVEATGLLRWSVTDPAGTEAVTLLLLLSGSALLPAVDLLAERGRRAEIALLVLLALELAGGLGLMLGSGLLQADWFGAMGWGTDALAAQRSAGTAGLVLAACPTLLLLVRAVWRRGRRPVVPPVPTEPVAAVSA